MTQLSFTSSGFTRRDWLASGACALAGLSLGVERLSAAPATNVSVGTGALALNENPFGPSPLAVAAIRDGLEALWQYPGDEPLALIRQIAAFEQVAPEQVVLGEIIGELGRTLALQGSPGGEFVYSVPGYPALVEAARRVGGRVIEVPLTARFENDLPALAARVTAQTRAVFVVNPHNPSGTVSDRTAFAEFLTAVSARTLVIVDEAYLEYVDDFAARTAANATRAGANVAVFRTFSKIHGLAALNFGYLVAPRALADQLRAAGVGASRELNRLAVAAASGSLRDREFPGRVRSIVATERAKWQAVLTDLRRPQTASVGNFVYFDAGRPHADIAAAFAREGLRIGRAFPPHATWVRISIGLPDDNARAQTLLRQLLA